MTEILLSYPAVLLRNWKLGRVQRNWYLRDRATFSERDLSNAMGISLPIGSARPFAVEFALDSYAFVKEIKRASTHGPRYNARPDPF